MFFTAIENAEDSFKVERLYYQYRKLMYKEAYAILQDTHLAEDAVDESFIRIIRNLHKIDEADVPATRNFLVIICRNVAKDLYNSRMYLNKGDALTEEITTDDAGLVSDPSDIVINKNTKKIMVRIIQELDPIYRDVFLLKRVYDMRRDEIAAIFGISEEAVKKRLLRAKIKIVTALAEEGIK